MDITNITEDLRVGKFPVCVNLWPPEGHDSNDALAASFYVSSEIQVRAVLARHRTVLGHFALFLFAGDDIKLPENWSLVWDAKARDAGG